RQGLLLDHRGLQRRPGAAVHRPGRDDAARRLVVRHPADRRRGLRLQRRAGLHDLPARRGRQGRSERHRGQPRPVPVHLGQGQCRAEEDREGLLRHRCPPGRGGREVDRQRVGADPARHGEAAGRLRQRRLPEVHVRHRQQGEGARPVVGPGAQSDGRRDAAGQHRQAVPTVHLPAAVRRQPQRGHRRMSSPATHPQRREPRSILPWLAVPALLMFVGFAVIPLVGVFALSFTTWDGIGDIPLSGLTSWRAVLTDPGLPHALRVTFLVMAVSWAVQTPLSILLGTFMAGRQRYRAVLGVVYFVPLMLSSAAIAIAYKALLDPNFGLGAGLKIPLLSQDWLGRPGLAFGVVVFVVSWQFIPFHSLIYQGGVQQIPKSLYEAAQLDGAGKVRQFFSITLPQLKYTIITSSTLMVIGS